MKLKQKIADFWGKNPPYKGIADCDEQRLIRESSVKGLMDRIAVKGEKLLEIGCGLGYDTRYLRSKGVDVTPIDISPSNAKAAGGLCMDAEELTFPDYTFDKVYSFGVLHHTPNTDKAIQEVYRVLKVDGECMIMLYHRGYAWWVLFTLFWWDKHFTNRYDNTPLSQMFSKGQVRNMFRQFSIVKFEMTSFQINTWAFKVLSSNKWLMNNFGQFIIVWAVK